VGYGVCLAGVKGSEPEVGLSPLPSATLRSSGAAQSRPISLHDEHRDNFAFTFDFTCIITTEKILKADLKILRTNCHDTAITEYGIISSDTSYVLELQGHVESTEHDECSQNSSDVLATPLQTATGQKGHEKAKQQHTWAQLHVSINPRAAIRKLYSVQ